MDFLQRIAEARIQEAADRGLFDDLPLAGRPLALADLSGVPGELRASYILLKGAGYLPEEMEAKKRILRLRDLLDACAEAYEEARLRGELGAELLRYRLLIERRTPSSAEREYRGRILGRLSS